MTLMYLPERVREYFGDGEEYGLSLRYYVEKHPLGTAGSAALARKLGAPLENGRIVVNEKMQTGIPGLFAAGDCTGGMLQVCKAVHEGALAATEAVKLVRGQK